MIALTHKQGSDAWIMARLGIPTASQFHRILTPARLKLSSQADDYMYQLLAEWATGEPADAAASQWMDRGTELEPEARNWYAFHNDIEVAEIGLCLTDDRRVGASPDGIVFGERGLEIKCRNAANHIHLLLDRSRDIASVSQVQGGMWVTGLEEWDVVAYCPGLPPRVDRIERDPEYMAALDEAMPAFLERLDEARARLIEECGIKPVDLRSLSERITAAEYAGALSDDDARVLRNLLDNGQTVMVADALSDIPTREAA